MIYRCVHVVLETLGFGVRLFFLCSHLPGHMVADGDPQSLSAREMSRALIQIPRKCGVRIFYVPSSASKRKLSPSRFL